MTVNIIEKPERKEERQQNQQKKKSDFSSNSFI